MGDAILERPVLAGLVTYGLMLIDWLLTVARARAPGDPSRAHYRTYPVDTVEGNPLLRGAVEGRRPLSARHQAGSLLLGALTWFVLARNREPAWSFAFLGLVWGSSLVLLGRHAEILVSSAAARRGVHGLVHLHQRTGYLMGAGRYAGTLLVLSAICVLVPHPFLLGTAAACLLAALRQLLYRLRVPPIEPGDPPPQGFGSPGV